MVANGKRKPQTVHEMLQSTAKRSKGKGKGKNRATAVIPLTGF